MFGFSGRRADGYYDEAGSLSDENNETGYSELDPSVHTAAHPFCYDMACPCHEDEGLVDTLGDYVGAGEVTAEEANRTYRGW